VPRAASAGYDICAVSGAVLELT